MAEAFKEVIGGTVGIDQKTQKPLKFNDPEWGLFWLGKFNEEEQERVNDDPITNDLAELLKNTNIGHFIRLDAFWASKKVSMAHLQGFWIASIQIFIGLLWPSPE